MGKSKRKKHIVPDAVHLIEGCDMKSVLLSTEHGRELFKSTLTTILTDKRQLGLTLAWRDRAGNSIQHVCVYRKLTPALEVLKEFGFRLDVVNKRGETVSRLAEKKGVEV